MGGWGTQYWLQYCNHWLLSGLCEQANCTMQIHLLLRVKFTLDGNSFLGILLI